MALLFVLFVGVQCPSNLVKQRFFNVPHANSHSGAGGQPAVQLYIE